MAALPPPWERHGTPQRAWHKANGPAAPSVHASAVDPASRRPHVLVCGDACSAPAQSVLRPCAAAVIRPESCSRRAVFSVGQMTVYVGPGQKSRTGLGKHKEEMEGRKRGAEWEGLW